MITITIYTTRTGDAINLGKPAVHTLVEPEGISRTWISRAEYVLPDGYCVGETIYGEPAIYRVDNNEHCELADSEWMGKGGGSPVLVDGDADPWRVKLDKVCDLPW